MNIRLLQGIEGAKLASGVTVIIDVFRAFTVECVAFASGVDRIWAVGTIEQAFSLAREHPGALLVGERGGRRCEGFDCGNSPSQLRGHPLSGRSLIHTTSAGTQGIVNAKGADALFGASLVNARATAAAVLSLCPEEVSLVCMGLAGLEERAEDTLCGRYLSLLLRGEEPDIRDEIQALRGTSGKKFFDPAKQEVFPEADFHMCTALNAYPFALSIRPPAHDGPAQVEKREV
ncbi:MAG: 2-phosphosulfolactate phosphatase [Clostridia bacterium]|nr:2-phosphosulfolactate phosphatase [Clostridia bacterium]